MIFALRGRLSVQFERCRASLPRVPLDTQGWLLPGCAQCAEVGPGWDPIYGSAVWELYMDEPSNELSFTRKPIRGPKPGVCGKGIDDTEFNFLFNHSESANFSKLH